MANDELTGTAVDATVAAPGIPAESRVFRMGAANFISHLIFTYAGPWLLALSATAVAGVAFGIAVDIRWFVVGMMMVFLVIPMLMGFMYYYYGLRRGCLVNSVTHAVVVDDKGITVRMLFEQPRDDADDADDPDGMETADKENADGERRYVERPEFFPYSDMKPYRIGMKSVVIPLQGKDPGFLWIPFDAFGETAVLEELLDYIGRRVPPAKS